jgi:DNA polymerase-3 subunit delta'
MDWQLLGHQWAVDLLAGQIARGMARHACLFTGPAGVGRRTLALRFAQAVNCAQPPQPGAFCGACSACRQTANMAHPDLSIVQTLPDKTGISVEQIRELQRSLALAPYAAPYRIALLLNFEDASDSAQNALLKTLEEPNPRVILLLTAASEESLLPTITSRCETLRLRPLGVRLLSRGLQTLWGMPPPQADLLAHLSSGRPGYAHYLHQHPDAGDQRRLRLDEHASLLPATRAARFAYAEQLAKDKAALRQALEIWASWWRDVLLAAAGSDAPLTNLDRAEEIDQAASRLSLRRAHAALRELERTLALLDSNVNARLAAETLLLNIPRVP